MQSPPGLGPLADMSPVAVPTCSGQGGDEDTGERSELSASGVEFDTPRAQDEVLLAKMAQALHIAAQDETFHVVRDGVSALEGQETY